MCRLAAGHGLVGGTRHIHALLAKPREAGRQRVGTLIDAAASSRGVEFAVAVMEAVRLPLAKKAHILSGSNLLFGREGSSYYEKARCDTLHVRRCLTCYGAIAQHGRRRGQSNGGDCSHQRERVSAAGVHGRFSPEGVAAPDPWALGIPVTHHGPD
jgi:hypothetical protein